MAAGNFILTRVKCGLIFTSGEKIMTAEFNYVVFAGTAAWPELLRDILPVLKRRFGRNRSDVGLYSKSKRAGGWNSICQRACRPRARLPAPQRGRGRWLGVVAGDLPRHWGWLEGRAQESRARFAGRRQAMRSSQAGKQRARRARRRNPLSLQHGRRS
jgi:hypothetical protein